MPESEKKIVVRLRLTPAEKNALEEEGRPHGRKLATEIAYRLRGGKADPKSSLFTGWPEEEAQDFQNLGDAVALLYMEVTRRLGTSADRKRRLGFMRSSVSSLLDAIGAAQISEVEAGWNAGATRAALTDERFKAYAANPDLGVDYIETYLARLVRELKARTTDTTKE